MQESEVECDVGCMTEIKVVHSFPFLLSNLQGLHVGDLGNGVSLTSGDGFGLDGRHSCLTYLRIHVSSIAILRAWSLVSSTYLRAVVSCCLFIFRELSPAFAAAVSEVCTNQCTALAHPDSAHWQVS